MKNTAKTLTLTATKAPRKESALAVPKTATSYQLETETESKVTVVKKGSRLAAVPAAEAAADKPAVRTRARKLLDVAETEASVEATSAEAAPAKPARTRVKKAEEAPAVVSAPSTASVTTDAAVLASIDTSGYQLPGVKVPGRRGRKPSEFVPENDEVAALNAVERAELKAASKARERKLKGTGLNGLLSDNTISEAELEKRRQQIKNLINMGKERGFLTYAEINDQLPENIIDPEAIEGIIATFNDMGIAVYERAPDAAILLLSDTVASATSDD
jgi:RNA polymerase primary sigma factor